MVFLSDSHRQSHAGCPAQELAKKFLGGEVDAATWAKQLLMEQSEADCADDCDCPQCLAGHMARFKACLTDLVKKGRLTEDGARRCFELRLRYVNDTTRLVDRITVRVGARLDFSLRKKELDLETQLPLLAELLPCGVAESLQLSVDRKLRNLMAL